MSVGEHQKVFCHGLSLGHHQGKDYSPVVLLTAVEASNDKIPTDAPPQTYIAAYSVLPFFLAISSEVKS